MQIVALDSARRVFGVFSSLAFVFSSSIFKVFLHRFSVDFLLLAVLGLGVFEFEDFCWQIS